MIVLLVLAIAFAADNGFRPFTILPIALLAMILLLPRPKATLTLTGRALVVKPSGSFTKPRTLDLGDLAQVKLERAEGTWWRIVLVLMSKDRIGLLASRNGKALEEQAVELDRFLETAMRDAGIGEKTRVEEDPDRIRVAEPDAAAEDADVSAEHQSKA